MRKDGTGRNGGNTAPDPEAMLGRLPAAEVPDGFADAVMARIATRPAPWWKGLFAWLSAPRTVSVSPLRTGLAAACLLAVFGLGYITGTRGGTDAATSRALAEAAEVSYRMGRDLLAAQRPVDALPHLERAAHLAPEEPDYLFWAGVVHWALGEPGKEAALYRRVVSNHPDHLRARLYLGHNYLDRGRYEDALAQYDGVLARDPGDVPALLNRGLALRALNREEAAAQSWRQLLEARSTGREAARAVELLNAGGDFGYQVHYLDGRPLVLPALRFGPSGDLSQDAEIALRRVGLAALRASGVTLHVVAYMDGDASAARERALTVRRSLLNMFPDLDPNRVKPSWFGVPERGGAGDAVFSLNESVRFIGLLPGKDGKDGTRT